jgi:peptidyl-dipeptidase A
MSRTPLRAAALVMLGTGLGLVACRAGAPGATVPSVTETEAKAFVERADKDLLEQAKRLSQAQWVSSNFITTDTEAISANTYQQFIAATMRYAKEAARFDRMELDADTERKLELLKLASIPLPAPSDAAKQDELTKIAAGLEADYGRGKYCPPGKPCLDVNAITKIMATSRDPNELLDVWRGWHAIAPPMKPRFQRFVELGNEGARELGYKDLGALWRSGYDMKADEFSAEVDRLWTQVKPLYDALHAHARRQLVKKYGPSVVPPDGPIPAHLLGNIWAQQWGNVYDLMGVPGGGRGYDLTKLLEARKTDPKEMVRYGDRFFTSLGFQPMPPTFWERSLFTKPQDRDVVCHASAWDVDQDLDLRIKMCIEITGEDFTTIHHELGHNIYQRAYRELPFLYRNSANDGFHEAIGDAIALSVTPDYLVKIGLLDKAPGAEGDLEYLMRMALDKVAFLPFGIVVDQWRWKVFSGEVTPDKYNTAWWELRRKYQNVAEPEPRAADAFDPGAKYHVPANTPYTRYFLAHILQFQFQRAMCKEAGFTGPLHRCSIYDNKAVGAKLGKMLAMGQSRPWPDALEALTGERQMDATAMIDYFKPLKEWLDAQAAAEAGAKPAVPPTTP